MLSSQFSGLMEEDSMPFTFFCVSWLIKELFLPDVNMATSVKAKVGDDARPRPAGQPKIDVEPNDTMLQIFCNSDNSIIIDFSCNENKLI